MLFGLQVCLYRVPCAGAMILRGALINLIIINFASHVWSHVEVELEDYFFPLEPVINFCKLADECQHDFVPVCAQDSLGITRMFNDVCDSYEYNCDENKQYRHVHMKMCQYNYIPAPYEWGAMGKK